MGYATYDYYRTTFMGSVIKDCATFDSVLVEAEAYIDRITHGNIKEVSDAVRNATCAVAEIICKQAQDEEATVASESVGNHSRTYTVVKKSAADREAEKHRKAALFLARTGLLYGGLK